MSNSITVTDIFSRYDEKIATLASTLRKLVLSQIENAMEIPDQSINLVGYGYGTGYKDLICTILLSKKGVKLGFYKGTELPDPSNLLEGSGKVHRYVDIKTEEEIHNPALKKLLTVALAAYRKRTA